MNVICLAIWVLLLIITVVEACNNEPASYTTSVCAMMVCIIHYLEKVLGVM